MTTRRSGLGRGLGALIPGGGEPGASTETIDLRERTFREVPINSITPNAYQPRKTFDETALEPLADSIKEVGVLQPILVRTVDNQSYELIAGERRWRASRMAGLKNIPVIVRDAANVQALEHALVENLHRKDLNPLDEASAYRQLIDDFSMTHEDVAKRVGKSRAAVTNLLRLMQLPPKIQKMLIEERLGEGHARALIPLEDAAFQQQLAERIARDGMTVRAVEEAVRQRNEIEKPLTSPRPRPAAAGQTGAPAPGSAAVLEWQERLTNHLDTRVSVSMGGRNGKLVIDFADLEDLERIAQIIESGGAFTVIEGDEDEEEA